MPERPTCCTCPPACDAGETGGTCADASCGVCLHGCPAPDPAACCRPATLPTPEVATAHQLVAAGQPLPAALAGDVLGAVDYLTDRMRTMVVRILDATDRHADLPPSLHEAITDALLGHQVDGHRYLSTACAHGEHARCRQSCKYCGAGCICPSCEHTGDDPGSILDQLTAVTAERDQWRQSTDHYSSAVSVLAADNDRLGDELDQLKAQLAALAGNTTPTAPTFPDPVGTPMPYQPGALTPTRLGVLQQARDGLIEQHPDTDSRGWRDASSYYCNGPVGWLIQHGLAAPVGDVLAPTTAGVAALDGTP